MFFQHTPIGTAEPLDLWFSRTPSLWSRYQQRGQNKPPHRLWLVQPESAPDPKTPAAHDVAVQDRKIPKISPATNFNMTTSSGTKADFWLLEPDFWAGAMDFARGLTGY